MPHRGYESNGRQNAIVPIPPTFGTPAGVYPTEFHQDFRHQKTRVPRLLRSIGRVIILAIPVEVWLATDGKATQP